MALKIRKNSVFNNLKSKFIIGSIGIFFTQNLLGQDKCSTSLTNFSPSTANNQINWSQFPEFSLPFSVVYGGPRLNDTEQLPLKHGFSHLATLTSSEFSLPIRHQAILDGGTAYTNKNQPWETLKSPWGNDLELYKRKYNDSWVSYWGLFESSQKSGILNADFLVFDIERQHKAIDSILVLRNPPSTPSEYKILDNQSFINSYNQDLQKMYQLPFQIFTERGWESKYKASYADTPILNTFVGIETFSWKDWTTNPAVLNPLCYDYSKKTVGGALYDAQTVLMPSAYYYFDYPSPFAKEYLTYLLFQIEVNKAWSKKPIIPFVWLKYSFNKEFVLKPIRPWMAEATAIFPFFSGATGLWLWDDPTTFKDDVNLANYEYFTKGLFRLSEFKEMFTGNYELLIPETAYALHIARKPVWRGILKDNFLLVAAHNPFANDENERTDLTITYKNWSTTITLKGYETFLCQYDLSVQSTENEVEDFVLFPNPASDFLQFEKQFSGEISLYSVQGKLQYKTQAIDGKINIKNLPSGIYIINFEKDKKNYSNKIQIIH